MFLVIGASGTVGRHVAAGLPGPVRRLARTARPGFVAGDLREPDSLIPALDGVDRVFLLWPGPATAGIEAAVSVLASRVRRIVYLSAVGAPSGFWGDVETAVAGSGVDWTFLRAGGFATNTLSWAGMIRADGVVRWPYGRAARSLVHERDLADAAVAALTTDAHIGRTYELTGPESLTQAEQVRQIGDAIGRELRWEELPSGRALSRLTAEMGDADFAAGALRYWVTLVDRPEPVRDGVPLVTGHPARTFRSWARDHASDFY
jgi:uncharacterized protein YbjT (DUF2867 family)